MPPVNSNHELNTKDKAIILTGLKMELKKIQILLISGLPPFD